jgi:hypothetical protein
VPRRNLSRASQPNALPIHGPKLRLRATPVRGSRRASQGGARWKFSLKSP